MNSELSRFQRRIAICEDFQIEWSQGRKPRIETFLDQLPRGDERATLSRELLALELELRVDDGESPKPEDYLQRFPDQESFIRAQFHDRSRFAAQPMDLLSRLPELSALREDSNATVSLMLDALNSSTTTSSPLVSRYRIDDPDRDQLGGGGCGDVFLGIDQELGREIALKKIQARRASRPDMRARFLREARVTAFLDHPNIVPIYGLGHDADGQPFYAMKLIRGQSLKTAIEEFHKAGPALAHGTGERMLALRSLLTRFLSVCDAVAFAHDRGVLHRDLKPENIMLGAYGETYVVDWGFAKLLREADFSESDSATPKTNGNPHAASPPPIFHPKTAEAGGSRTQSGAVLGTPQYMSPEQAAGDQARVDRRSDVFSLGATLYTILVNQPPITGDTREQRWINARECVFPPPRQVNPTVDPSLDSICLKAMKRLPADRYSSARELAKDVERWLADEPISSRPDSRWVKIARWSRHHRAWTMAAIVLLSTTAIASAIGTFFVMQEKNRVQAAKNDSDANLQIARDAIKRALTEIVSGPLATMPQAETLRHDLAKNALSLIEQLLKRNPDDPRLLQEKAEFLRELGNIERQFGRLGAAIERYEEALKAVAELEAQLPLALAHSKPKSLIYVDISESYRMKGQPSQAKSACIMGLRISRPEFRRPHALLHSQLAIAQADAGEFREARESYETALSLLRAGPQKDQYDPESQLQLAMVECDYGGVLREEGLVEIDKIMNSIDCALRLCSSLILANPFGDNNNARFVQAKAHWERAKTISRSDGRPDTVITDLQTAIITFESLAAQFPNTPRYRQASSLARIDLAETLGTMKRRNEALANAQSSADALESLANDFPDNFCYQGNLGLALVTAGRLSQSQGGMKSQTPTALFQKARKHLQAALAQNPTSPVTRQAFAFVEKH